MPRSSTGEISPGTVSPLRAVPAHIPRPEYVGRPAPAAYSGGDRYSAEEIERIRRAGRIAADAIALVERELRPGMTTEAVDVLVHEFLLANDAYPSTLGYRGFPKSCCTSLNEVVCHGIPDSTVIESGDILNVDVTAYLDGMHGDTNRTLLVGEVRPEVRALVAATQLALERAIRTVAPGRQVNVIGRAIESYAKRFGYGVVRDYTGHGVGRAFHTGLIIPHVDDERFDTVLEPGMVFTIEPMLTLGSAETELWPDDWTVVTADGSWTAQFEHTLVVTESGAEILTRPTTL